MKDVEIAALAKGLVPFVREVVTEAVTPLGARLAELEARPIEKGDTGEKGPQGEIGPQGPVGPKGDSGEQIMVPPDLAEQIKSAIHMLHESPPIVAREDQVAPKWPSSPKVIRIDRNENGALVPVYDDETPA